MVMNNFSTQFKMVKILKECFYYPIFSMFRGTANVKIYSEPYRQNKNAKIKF